MTMFAGCSAGHGDKSQQALDFRRNLMDAGGCSFTARVTADYGDRCYQFTMDCAADREKTRLLVTAPEELTDIAATVSADGTQLEFDGAQLDFGELNHGLTPPVTMPWLLWQCWTGEYIDCAGADGDLERVTYLWGFDDEEVAVDTWFDAGGMPVYAEVSVGDVRCLSAELLGFHF